MSAERSDDGAGSGNGPASFSRLRRPLAALCIAQVIAAAVALVVVSSSSHGHSRATPGPSPSVGSGPGAPGVAAAQSVLDRHATAVRSHDRNAYLADVDTSAAAAAYRAQQGAAFDNLAHVPLAAWSYRISAPVTEGSVLTQAAARYHAAVLIAQVAFSYQLRDADPAPTAHDLWLTFVRRGGKVRIAADSDMADVGGASWHGPWDFAPVAIARGTSSLVLAHPDNAARAAAVATLADDAVRAVSGVWGTGWSQRIVVVLPDSDAEMSAVVGGSGSGGSIGPDLAAETVADETNPGTGLRIVLSPADLARLSVTGLAIVLRHEITHAAAWGATVNSAALPVWLVEGFADYVGNLGSGQPVATAAAELRAEVRAGRVAATLPADQQFSAGGTRLPQLYEEAWLACRLIAAIAGQDGLVRFYREVARSTATPDAALDAALRVVVKLNTAQFTERWRQYLRAQLA